MTDRELLELAAKAAGIRALRDSLGFLRNCTNADPAQNIFSAPLWNPLADDGDALRLAVKLGIGLEFVRGLLVITSPNLTHEDRRDHGDDLTAATRRAIVRAAAEIGKAM